MCLECIKLTPSQIWRMNITDAFSVRTKSSLITLSNSSPPVILKKTSIKHTVYISTVVADQLVKFVFYEYRLFFFWNVNDEAKYMVLKIGQFYFVSSQFCYIVDFYVYTWQLYVISVLDPIGVDLGFDPRAGQTKDYNTGICCWARIIME